MNSDPAFRLGFESFARLIEGTLAAIDDPGEARRTINRALHGPLEDDTAALAALAGVNVRRHSRFSCGRSAAWIAWSSTLNLQG